MPPARSSMTPFKSAPPFVYKSFGVETSADLPDRQIRVRISTDQVDRTGDIVVQKGIHLDNYKASRTVLWNHDHDHPVAACLDIGLKSNGLEALTQFPDAGISAKADEVYGLLKAGVINAASIGFLPLAAEPVDKADPRGGLRFDRSDLMEFSFVSVPANPGAQVLERSLLQRSLRSKAMPPKMTLKGLYAVSVLADLLQVLGYQVDSAFAERAREGDGSNVPEQLRDALHGLGQALIAMTEEEVNELLAGGGDASCWPDMPMFLGLLRGVFKGGEIVPGTVGKAGRQFSAANAKTMRGHLAAIATAHAGMSKMLDDAGADDDAEDVDDDSGDPDEKAARDQRRRQVETLWLAHPQVDAA